MLLAIIFSCKIIRISKIGLIIPLTGHMILGYYVSTMAARLRLTFIAVGVFRIFNKTVKLFFIIRHGCYRAGRLLEIYARTLTCPQHAQKACAWFLLFTKNIHIRGERDEPDFSARVDIHFKVVVQSPSKDSSKTRSQPRELVKIEYYCATKKQQYTRWNYYDNTLPRFF